MMTSAFVETLGYLKCYSRPTTEGRPTALPSGMFEHSCCCHLRLFLNNT